jgi:hypothetical protein
MSVTETELRIFDLSVLVAVITMRSSPMESVCDGSAAGAEAAVCANADGVNSAAKDEVANKAAMGVNRGACRRRFEGLFMDMAFPKYWTGQGGKGAAVTGPWPEGRISGSMDIHGESELRMLVWQSIATSGKPSNGDCSLPFHNEIWQSMPGNRSFR